MKPDIIQQEILLITGTSFSQRQLIENDAEDDRIHLSESQRLEQAIWTGLLDELLPEVITNKELRIWQIWDSEISLQIELSEYPSKEKRFSINAHYFLRTMEYN